MAPWIDFEKIKREADFATILRHYGFEFPKGRTQLKLSCPFHEDAHPSLSVNLTDKVFHCFGCAAKGGLLDFVQRMERRNGRTVGARPVVLKVAELCGITGYEIERPTRTAGKAPQRRRDEDSGVETTEAPSAEATPVLEAPAPPQANAEAAAKPGEEEPGEIPREVNPPRKRCFAPTCPRTG